MSNKKDISEMLVSMGFPLNYIQRAFKVYEKNYGHSYNVEVITEIIVRLQNKDKSKKKQSSPQQQPNNDKNNKKPPKPSKSVKSPSPNKSNNIDPQKSSSSKPRQNKKNETVNISHSMNQKQQRSPHKNQNLSSNNMNNKKRKPQPKTPPVAYSGNHSHAHTHIGNMSTLNRSKSNENKLQNQSLHQQQYQNNNNMQLHRGNNRHIKSQSNMSPQNIPIPRFATNDIVTYNGIESEVVKQHSDGRVEITYPLSSFIMQRSRAIVPPHSIQKKIRGQRHTQPPISNANANNNGQQQSYRRSPQRPPPSSSQQQNNKNHGLVQSQTKQSKEMNNNKIIKKEMSVVETDNMPAFQSHMTLKQGKMLKIHDKIDHRDQVGRFVFATVCEKQGTNLKIHYDGWSRKWDTWSDFNKEIHRFAIAGSISKRRAHRFCELKKSDYVDINPSQRHPGWKCGEIRRLDQKSGQVQVVYECAEKNYLYWAHLDNKEEIAEFPTQSGLNHQINGQQQQILNEQNKKKQKEIVPIQDEMEAFARIRAKRFPRYQNEVISNKYGIGDWLEVQDTQTMQWITATVIDKENNWIVVHFDGWPSKYDQKIHSVKHEKRLRELGGGLAETQEEKDIKEEMASFLAEVQQMNWKLVVVDADGNCLYRCFATQIYGDTNKQSFVRHECCQYMRKNRKFFENFIPDFDQRMFEKEQEYEWGDHVDITALSELYNVRVRVFEYDKEQKKLYMSFDQGEHEQTINLPLVLLARHRQKHYNIIIDPEAVHNRPLGNAKDREKNESVSLQKLRLDEDAKEAELQNKNDESKDDEKDHDHDNQQSIDDSMLSNQFSIRSNDSFNNGLFNNLQLKMQSDFVDVMASMNLNEPLTANQLTKMFGPLIKKIYKKIETEWKSKYMSINKEILNRFWAQQFENKQQNKVNCKKWINSLKEKIPNGQYPANACLVSFNRNIVGFITDNLGHVVDATRKRQSTIDVHRISQQQPMDIDQ